VRKALLLTLATCTILAACSRNSSQDAETARAAAAPRAVSTARVEHRAMTAELALSGVLTSREEAAVSSQLSGYPVARVFVDQNDVVRAGQPLAQLDDTLLHADIAQQQAVLAQQKIAAERASAEAGRVANLGGSGALSSEAIAERQLGARTALATVAQARAALRSLTVKAGLMTIRAPVAGRILSRAVRPGDIAAPATVMFRIARDNLVEVDAEVPEQSIGAIRVGQPATVVLPSGRRLAGRVRLVSAEIDPQTKLGRARILMPPDRDLRPGGFADVKLSIERDDANAVPESAVQYTASGAAIMVLDANDRAHSMAVRTGVHSDGWVALESGPPAGTRVMTGGQGFVLDGDIVKPVAGR
jgi:HlyD family secretion protein